MSKRLLFYTVAVCACFLLAVNVRAQYYFHNSKYYSSDVVLEAGVSIGAMNSLTDLGGTKGIGKKFIKDLNLKVTKPSFSLYAIAMYRDFIGVRLEGTFGKIESYDSILKKKDPDLIGRYGRNLSFRSKISDFQLALEIHPLFFKHYDENEAPYWSPYLVAGIGYFSFNPQANLDGRWYDLYPLHLEGQGFEEYPDRKRYKLNQINIPLGAGIKYELNSFLNMRFEIVYRKLFTDYLDDVSTTYVDPSLFNVYLQPSQAAIAQRLYSRMQELQPGYIVKNGQERGDPKDKDAYFTIQLKIGATIRSNRR
jgi:Domain of unknown function (DUF6089)